MPRLPAASVDLVVCDLPYGATYLRWDKRLDLDRLWEEWKRLLTPGGAVLLFAQQPFSSDLVAANRSWFCCEWIWEKKRVSGWLNVRFKPLRAHESILVFADGRPRFQPQGVREGGRRRWQRTRSSVYGGHDPNYTQRTTGYPRSVLHSGIEHARPKACSKPVELLDYLIRSYSLPGETVLDNCMGLGSAGVAAVRSGRRFIGIELDRKRFNQARRAILNLP